VAVHAPSGSVAGLSFRQHRGHTVLLSKPKVRRYRSTAQRTVCVWFSQISARWRDTLTNDQRLAWHRFAAETAMTYRPGPPKRLGGRECYIQVNIIRKRAALAYLDTAPVVGAISPAPIPVILFFAPATIVYYATGQLPGAGQVFLCSLSRQHSRAALNPRIVYRQHFILTGPLGANQTLTIAQPCRAGMTFTLHTRLIVATARPSTFHSYTATI
jgi:hypothetical protein